MTRRSHASRLSHHAAPCEIGRYTAHLDSMASIRGSEHVVKVVILAGGLGTRLSEETASRPKPMVEIGERPILWHIMKGYSHFGFSDFVICLGYKGYLVKEYFSNYFLHMSDVTFDMRDNSMEIHQHTAEPWRVTLVETGAQTQTGGRLKRIGDYVRDGTFLLTYGDGVSDVDIAKLVAFHREHGRLATVTAVQPLGRFGALQLVEDDAVGSVFGPGGPCVPGEAGG